MRAIIFLLIFSGKLLAQVIINPTSTISCRNWYSLAILTINGGTSPYSYSVQTPSCSSTFTDSSTGAGKSFSLSCPGEYTFAVSDANNILIGVVTHSVSLATHIAIQTYADLDTICIGTYLTIGATDSLGGNFIQFKLSSIKWSNGDTIISPTVGPTITTIYSFTGVANGTMMVYPFVAKTCTVEANPVKDKLILSNESQLNIDKINMTNTLGQIVFVSNEAEKEIDVSFLSSGIYYLKVENKEGQKVFKY